MSSEHHELAANSYFINRRPTQTTPDDLSSNYGQALRAKNEIFGQITFPLSGQVDRILSAPVE